MAAVSVTNIRVLNNPCPLNAPFLFEIHFEALQALKHDVEWRVVYVGSGEHHSAHTSSQKEKALTSSAVEKEGSGMQADGEGPGAAGTGSGAKKPPSRGADYVLDSVLLGPIQRGALAFEFAVSAPDFTQMDRGSVEGMQAVLVCGLYEGKEFVRIGYYLNNAYSDPALRECPPEEPLYNRLVRCVVDAPRVTRFQIPWDDQEPSQSPADAAEASSSMQEPDAKGAKRPAKSEYEDEAHEAQQQKSASPVYPQDAGALCEMEVDVN